MKRRTFIITALLSVFLCLSNMTFAGNDGKVKEITEKTFDASISKGVVIVDFWATWCGPCRMVAPIVEEIAQERPDIKVCKVNVDEEAELASQFGIMSIPTLMVMKNGEIPNKALGARPKDAILALL